jgi:hypothetical protein
MPDRYGRDSMKITTAAKKYEIKFKRFGTMATSQHTPAITGAAV